MTMENTTHEVKITNSMSSNSQNPKPPYRHTKTREEGELSSSTDGDENHVCLATQSAGLAKLAPAGSIPVPPLNKFTEGIQARKATSGTNSANSVDVQSYAFVQPNNDKSFEKNRVPFKSANPGWHGPQGVNSNLVISFSDDDTGSESEDRTADKALEIKRTTAGVGGHRKFPSRSFEKSSKLQQTSRNVNKVTPKKLSISRTFISSTPNINGGAHSRSAVPSSIDQGSRVKNFVMHRKFTSPERGFDQSVGLNNTKLEDLRQQIALRERELKLKAAHQNKESASVPGRDYAVVNLGADTVRKRNGNSPDVRKLEPKEADRKRLKVSGSYSAQLASDRRQEIISVKSAIPLKEQALENSALQDIDMVDHSKKGSPSTRVESSVVKRQKQDDKRVDISSENLSRANVSHNCPQTDRSIMMVDPCVLVNQTATVTNMNSSILPKNVNSIELNRPVNIGVHQPPYSLLKTSTNEQHLMNGCEYREGVSNDRTVESSLNNISQASLNDVGLWNYLGTPNVQEHSNIDMHSLVEMEESLDKELEEAQEHRRMCEIEERNALKAYRKAQRALVEANARCTELYRRRELYSAQFRSFVLNDSSLLWSTRKHEHVGIGLNNLENMSRNLELMPPSSHPRRPEYDGLHQLGYDSNIQCADGDPLKMSYRHANGQNLGSEPCSEPDASTSEPLHINRENAANVVSSPSNDPNILADEDEETSPLDHATVQPTSNQQREINSLGRQKNTSNHTNKNFSIDGSQDSLILEATLRSELFARLGRRMFPKNNGLSNLESAEELGTENDNGSERTQTSNGSIPLSETERNQEFDLGGNDQPERDVFGATAQIDSHKKQDNEYSAIGHESAKVLFSPALMLRSAFGHMKVESPFNSVMLQSRKNQQAGTSDFYNGAGGCINSGDIQQSILVAKQLEESFGNRFENGSGSFTCDVAVDPFWPLCLYELRGKCNNDECPWQHVRDFSNEKVGQHQHDDSDNAGCRFGLTLQKRKCNGATELSKCCSVLTPPTYLVGLDVLKADPHAYKSVVAWRYGPCWQKCFSICLALSNLLQQDLPVDETFLHGSDGRIEVNWSWDKPSSYFQRRNNIMNHLNQMLPEDMQSLEKALLILSQEANKLEGMKKALCILSRAIEADPKSEILWITYLLIYYGNIKSMKEDMFSFAVKHNDRSYGLWLMYINSRMHLDDRLAAYDAALTALCRHASACEGDEMHASTCILDMFLQMMNCLCISGNVEKAIQKINGLFPVASNSDQESHFLLLSDILASLRISDKYIFWVCCVYLVIYRKLPEAVVQKFECNKELLSIEWPSCTHLLYEEKLRAKKLIEMAVDSVKLSGDTESLASEADLRSAQRFGLCHIRCVVALDGLECCRSLLDEYMKLHPFCLEFVLTSARIRMNDFNSFDGFEEALGNWPKETPGIHCIWNQYIELALQKGDIGLVKELLVRWFNSISEFQYRQREKQDALCTNGSDGLSVLASASKLDFLTSNSNQMDRTFGYLNFSLAKLLVNDHTGALNAIDKAFKAAPPPIFRHCLREHANFLLNYELKSKKDAFISEQLNVLNGYLDDAQALPVSEPLSRRFMNKIEKPRVRQLISNILSPVTCDFSLVNIVLEVWCGPSLLPLTFGQPKELVDFVEAILEIVPSNYQLAFSACKLLSRGEHFSKLTSGSMLYWASSTLVNAIFHAIPIAPEYVWVDAAGILGGIEGIELISERFYKRALSVYPLSINLWNCYYNLSKARGDVMSIVEAAREKGIELG